MNQKLIILIFVILGFSCRNSESQDDQIQFQNGDLIFHASTSNQSKAIQVATKSKYSHCGIIYKNNDEYYVFEAVQPVKLTPLNEWILRGEGKHFVVKRLKNSDKLNDNNLKALRNEGEKFLGKSYDLAFEWSDEKIYCSELIYKVYDRALNVQIGKLQTLGDFDLSNKVVQIKLKERYGNNIPLEEKVISPKSIFESKLLKTVYQN